jgi:dTDP-4-dehydrorhamnose 3,5-epimerase
MIRNLNGAVSDWAILLGASRLEDDRGYFGEIFHQDQVNEIIGTEIDWKQDNNSMSHKVGTLRGLHFQAPPCAQAKLVRCGQGAIFDVVVDIRLGSPTYGKWEGYELSEENARLVYVPEGFAHGFVTLRPNSEIIYKCSRYYSPETEGSIHWDDPDVGIKWPLTGDAILSEKDKKAPFFRDLESPFSWGETS